MATDLFSVRFGLNICIKFRLKSVNRKRNSLLLVYYNRPQHGQKGRISFMTEW